MSPFTDHGDHRGHAEDTLDIVNDLLDRGVISESQAATILGRLTFRGDGPGFFDTWLHWPSGEEKQLAPSAVPKLWVSDQNVPVTNAPIPVWSIPSAGGMWSSIHTDQYRWVKVMAYLQASDWSTAARSDVNFVDVPLKDNDDNPYFDPVVPPLVMMRRSTDTGDWVGTGASGQHGTNWTDSLCAARPPGDLVAAPFSWATLRLSWEPKPHWVLRLQIANYQTVGNRDFTLMADCYGAGFGTHNGTDISVGSAGTAGYHRRWLLWTQQDFNSTSSAANADERCFASGKFWNTTHAGAQTYYLRSPNGEVGDSDVFDNTHLPGVRVYSGNRVTDPGDTDETDWRYNSMGTGIPVLASPPTAGWTPNSRHTSELYDGAGDGAGPIQLDIHNDTSAGGGIDVAYMVFAIGKKDGS